MKTRLKRTPLVLLLLAGILFISCVPALRNLWYEDVGTVVSAHPIATEIGMEVLRDGGNAVDAAMAVGFAMGVVDQFHSGIGGGGFIVIRMADGTIHTIDGRETAPAAATRDMYLRNGEFDPLLSQEGVLAVGVPGIVAAYEEALELAGTKTLAEAVQPSIPVARDGFVLDEPYAHVIRETAEKLKTDPASRAIYLHEDGSPLAAGEMLLQPDLAATYEKIAARGTDYFYKGEFAEQLESGRFEQELVLLLSKSDVTEETDRLQLHLAEVEKILNGPGPVGRRLDFLMQELNREANTLGSKSNHPDTTTAAVDLKVLTEQMREQIQNIE